MRRRITLGAVTFVLLVLLSLLTVVALAGCETLSAPVAPETLAKLESVNATAQATLAQLQAAKPALEAALQLAIADTDARAKVQVALDRANTQIAEVNGVLTATKKAIADLSAKPNTTVADVVTAAGGVVTATAPPPWGAIAGGITALFAAIWSEIQRRRAKEAEADADLLALKQKAILLGVQVANIPEVKKAISVQADALGVGPEVLADVRSQTGV